MRYTALELNGVFLIEPEPHEDERGLFARIIDLDELRARGCESRFVQQSISWNALRGTLRGLHYQAPPHAETKIVRCTKGSIFDVVVDLRRQSATYQRWIGIDLTDHNRHTLYIPAGCAHGFVTLTDGAEVHYQISAPFDPSSARGVRWDDPSFAIEWPITPVVMSARDRNYPDYEPEP